MSDPIILCENLVKIHKVADLEVQALQGLDLAVAHGELLGIVGASGSGKSTLLNILGGLDRPTAGRAWVDGHDLLKLNSRDFDSYRRKTVGFVWQHGTRNLVPYLTAEENVQLPLTLAGQATRKLRERALDLLKRVGLADRRHHRLEQLSGGEQQRVAIAVAMINQPRILLADEPTGEVDTATALSLYDTFRAVNRELGLTTVIVSHVSTLARHVDRVVAVRDGKLAAETRRRAATEEQPHESFHEVTVLDSAGRLQVPKPYLEHFKIKRRVELEMIDQGILIKPVVDDDHLPTRAAGGAEDKAVAQSKNILTRLFGRWTTRKNGASK
jgi:ABC-type lipoprotein export system ATPase subunit/bifunctional DNA-binding transcriptional regulator/antitoxin component of YhaV-PrlF toxin-antitoxin module